MSITKRNGKNILLKPKDITTPSSELDYVTPVTPIDEPKPEKVTLKMKVVHGANIAWQFCKGKKRYAAIALLGAGYIADMTGNLPLGGLLKLLGGASVGVVAVEKVGVKLNEKTSGKTINWTEIIKAILEILKKVFANRKQN